MRSDGTVFTDRDVHRMLRINGVKNPEGNGSGARLIRSRRPSLLSRQER